MAWVECGGARGPQLTIEQIRDQIDRRVQRLLRDLLAD
jgi:hypothetical protein